MSSTHLAFASDGVRALSVLSPGARGTIVDVRSHDDVRTARLVALGITSGASIVVLQTFPSIVFMCDQTEIAIERGVADVIVVKLEAR